MPRFEFEDFQDPDDAIRSRMFQNPDGNSALRRESKSNPRIYDCPTCHGKNLLTAKDVANGYQCNGCADAKEGCF